MTEDRIRTLEREVSDLRVANAGLAASVEHLSTAVESLTSTVTVLNNAMNQGKGAARLVLALAAMGGGGLGAILALALRKAGIG